MVLNHHIPRRHLRCALCNGVDAGNIRGGIHSNEAADKTYREVVLGMENLNVKPIQAIIEANIVGHSQIGRNTMYHLAAAIIYWLAKRDKTPVRDICESIEDDLYEVGAGD